MSGQVKSKTKSTVKQSTPTTSKPKPETKGFGSNSAGSGKHVHLDPKDVKPGEMPWLQSLDNTMLA